MQKMIWGVLLHPRHMYILTLRHVCRYTINNCKIKILYWQLLILIQIPKTLCVYKELGQGRLQFMQTVVEMALLML